MEVITRIMEQLRVNSQALSPKNQNSLQRTNEKPWKNPCYSCDKCRDTGFVVISQEMDAPFIRMCQCRKMELVKIHWTTSGINPEWSTQTFNNFKVWNEGSKRLRDTSMAYYKNFEYIRKNRKNSILLCGQVGSGKTHCSVALALNLLKKGVKVVYMPYRDVITNIKQNMLDDESYRKIIRKYKFCEVLLLDDLFKGKLTEADFNSVFEIINYRYLNNLPIIVSTEFTVERLLSFDEAIGSRIYEMCKDYIVEVKKDMKNNYRLAAI